MIALLFGPSAAALLRPLGLAAGDTPLDPDAEQAREWLREELSKLIYQEAQPTWFDRLATALWEWITSLSLDGTGGGQGLGVVLVLLLVAAVIVAAFFIFGPPARSRRSRIPGEIFGEDDGRDAAAMRRDAERSAAAGRWADATADMFRAIARGLSDRTLVTMSPGTTAQHFAGRATSVFPDHGAALAASATDFDEVRYLGHDGSRDAYERVAALERELRSARPVLPEAAAAPAGTAGATG
ncbi:uncharacterized protein DUF4129 [Homoserinimonas aerilata]|uniref:Uncharacterized protein DUF4129 n=1 Tax=Homoserinimonas aerilata TaxID=1162970 RepID=A0A542YKH5_9MICO|nr:DUF4129 domain-containing protein [Homoserinimonas aerilata]TQL48597.1 uncharacterized protein DUF4129 [Homoserinimonas aerilata]